MATRSVIAKKQDNGQIKASYCHYDGYLEHVGEILNKHYTDKSKIDALLNEGDISCLDKNIGEKIDFDDFETLRKNGQCRFYHRDRNEKLTLEVLDNVAELESYANDDCCAEYIYLFMENKWHVLGYETKGDFDILEDLVLAENVSKNESN